MLLSGPVGLGQYSLGLALAQAWLCETPMVHRSNGAACGHCPSCHAIEVRTHPDLCVLMPEILALELGWPLDEKTQDRIERKEIKPGKFIRVDATREAVAFTQVTHSRSAVKVVLVYPADRLNVESANTLLKTLEEPPGDVRFVLVTEAAHSLLPTIRSRCQNHTMQWPDEAEALAWLSTTRPDTKPHEWTVWLQAAGGRPDEALALAHLGISVTDWQHLPQAIAAGHWNTLSSWSPARQLDVLQKLCHDLLSAVCGGQPRFFSVNDLPAPPPFQALLNWQKSLQQAARTVEHPYNINLLQEAWAAMSRSALSQHK